MRRFKSRNFKKQYDLGQYSDLYRNSLFSHLKQMPFHADKMKPFELDFGPASFRIARHFGFCKGVENAIEVAYEALVAHPDKRVFMISELIHNSFVNDDLKTRGLSFIKKANGEQLIPWEEIAPEDIVIIPAFGTTLEDMKALQDRNVKLEEWNATCRFVENVWFRARELGEQGYSIIIHGKFRHEETLSTLSHSRVYAPTVVVKNMQEAEILSDIILGKKDKALFFEYFAGKYSEGFDPEKDLDRVAVVNQTTMLATETAAISDHFKKVFLEKYSSTELNFHIANTRDTLCYATKNNQNATQRMLDHPADMAIVIGGRNSSNTSHLVELCEGQLPTYFIASERDILSRNRIRHYDFRAQEEQIINNFLPNKNPVNILLTSGASCPDAIVERVLWRLLENFEGLKSLEEILSKYDLDPKVKLEYPRKP